MREQNEIQMLVGPLLVGVGAAVVGWLLFGITVFGVEQVLLGWMAWQNASIPISVGVAGVMGGLIAIQLFKHNMLVAESYQTISPARMRRITA